MRLGQLSRKLGLKPSDIHDFLKEKDPSLEANPNTRLTEDQVLLAIRRFDPAQETTILADSASAEPEETPAVEPAPSTEPILEAQEPAAVDTTPEAPLETAPEVIRAPKQELPGLRVVGKIELKDPKKKDTETQTEEQAAPSAPDQQDVRPRRTQPPVRRERPQRSWQNPLEAQRQREAEERKAKREQEIQREKDRRTQQYLKKVKSAPTKAVRKQEEVVVETEVEARPAPKTWLGKIARWLTT